MKFESIGDKQNQAKLIRDILITKLGNEVNELEDNYGIPPEIIEELSLSLFVDHGKKVLWKAGRTKFTKLFDKEATKLIKEHVIDFDDLGLLTYIASTYTEYEDNYLKKDGEFLSKKELINDLVNDTNKSESYFKKKLLDLEKKNLILSEQHPKDKRNKVFYLTPYLFYKGRYMDNKAKQSLLKITKTVHENIKQLNKEGNINIPLDKEFETKSNDMIINELMEYLNEAV